MKLDLTLGQDTGFAIAEHISWVPLRKGKNHTLVLKCSLLGTSSEETFPSSPVLTSCCLPLDSLPLHLPKARELARLSSSTGRGQCVVADPSFRASGGSTYIMHGVQELGQLIEPLPTLPRIVGTFSYHLPQLFDVICPHFFKCSLASEAILWNCVVRITDM